MSSTNKRPLIEKYRPSTLADVIGHDAIIERCLDYVAKYKAGDYSMPHLMFSGPAGTGKTTIAKALARELYGPGWKNETLDTNASDDRGIGIIRGRVKDFAKTYSSQEGFSIIILDEMDNLTKDAQQALRRIMEDYSSQCRFILCCNYPHKVIEPLRNRCAQYQFRPVDTNLISTRLQEICQEEGLAYEEEGLREIAANTSGSPRQAINALQTIPLPFSKANVQSYYSTIITTSNYFEIITKVVSGDVRKGEEALVKIIAEGTSPEQVFQGFFDAVHSSSLDEKAKSKILFTLGEYEFRVMSGCHLELQARCFLRHLHFMSKGG